MQVICCIFKIYYFKSKEVLFARVFEVTFGVLMSKLNAAMGKDEHLFDMIRSFTSIHIDTVQKNARLPRFIVSELGRNPERMIKLIDNSKEFDIRKKFEKAVREAVMLDEIIEIDPNQLFSNMLSMCIFPFLGRPMIQFALTMDDKEFKAFIDKRKTEVAEFIIRSIQKK